MLSKNKLKFLASLSDKKVRTQHNLFLVEGEKMVEELLLSDFKVQTLLFTEKMNIFQKKLISSSIEKIEISEAEALKLSTQKTPQGIFAVAFIPSDYYTDNNIIPEDIVLALQDIQDPGNLGTIIRTADWFGIKQIICSKATADIFNPKVLQSTMGAAFRVKVMYTDLYETILNLKAEHSELPIYAAVLEGENIYTGKLTNRGIIMMGNESKGLAEEMIQLSTKKITIPRFGNSAQSSESLNVSIATAIIVAEFRRKIS